MARSVSILRTLVHALLFSSLGLYRALSGGMTVVPSFEGSMVVAQAEGPLHVLTNKVTRASNRLPLLESKALALACSRNAMKKVSIPNFTVCAVCAI